MSLVFPCLGLSPTIDYFSHPLYLKIEKAIQCMNGLGAGCVQLWIRSAEPPGEHRYENRNSNTIQC